MKRVLFVDDDPPILAGLRRMFRGQRGEWDMHFAHSGEEALQLFSETPFDVIVSDMRMPRMDGSQLLEQIRLRFPDTVRIVLSGQSQNEAIMRCIGPAHQFLSKPCVPEQLCQTISRACRLKEHLTNPALQKLVTKIDNLPVLGDLYQRLVTELQRPDSSISQVAELIASDLSMTAKVLQLVNSSFFGLPQRITDPKQAVSLLGLNLIQTMVLSAGVFFHPGAQVPARFCLESLVHHCLAVGWRARAIAQQESPDPRFIEDALLAGMMHDVGKLVLATGVTSAYGEVLEKVHQQGANPLDAERERFGVTHADVGGFLLELWGLPATIVEGVVFHHRPADVATQGLSLAGIVHVANALETTPSGDMARPPSPPLDWEFVERAGWRDKLEGWRQLPVRPGGAM